MTKLADDLKVLRAALSNRRFFNGEEPGETLRAIERAEPFLAALASLTPEQARDIGEMLTDAAYDLDEDHAAPGLKAAYLRAATIFSRLGES